MLSTTDSHKKTGSYHEEYFPFLCIPVSWTEQGESLIGALVLTVVKPIDDAFGSLITTDRSAPHNSTLDALSSEL